MGSAPFFCSPVDRAMRASSNSVDMSSRWHMAKLIRVLALSISLATSRSRSQLRIKPAGASPAPADGCDYFSSATCTLSEPSTVRILARSASLLLAASTEPSTLALICSSLPPR
jgi:hypothetical protein